MTNIIQSVAKIDDDSCYNGTTAFSRMTLNRMPLSKNTYIRATLTQNYAKQNGTKKRDCQHNYTYMSNTYQNDTQQIYIYQNNFQQNNAQQYGAGQKVSSEKLYLPEQHSAEGCSTE